MKKFLRLFVNLTAIVMLTLACVGLFGCSKSDIVKVELQLSIYNSAENKYYDQEDTTLTIELYRHYAEETVDAILGYIEDGYYDDAIFYGLDSNKIMLGDLKMNASGEIYQNELMPTLTPEFERGAVQGSDLTVKEGSIGLWRTWPTNSDYKTSNMLDSGRATWFMPTSEISAYNDYFCVFAVMDMDDADNSTTWGYLKAALTDNADTYYVYYTGSYDKDSEERDGGLLFHCEDEQPDEDSVFKPEGAQPDCYKSHQIKVAKGVGNTCGAKIVSAKII